MHCVVLRCIVGIVCTFYVVLDEVHLYQRLPLLTLLQPQVVCLFGAHVCITSLSAEKACLYLICERRKRYMMDVNIQSKVIPSAQAIRRQ